MNTGVDLAIRGGGNLLPEAADCREAVHVGGSGGMPPQTIFDILVL